MSKEVTQNMGQFDELLSIIDSACTRALKAVNAELIWMYWNVGEYLSGLCANSGFGDKVIDEVAAYIATANPGLKGFNRRGLYRMKQFYETYKDDEFVTPLVTQIQLDKPPADPVRCKVCGRRAFLHGFVRERALFQARAGAPDRQRLL